MGVRLSRSAWHYRLQKYAYGREPEAFNFCPYFWSTILALVFLPTSLLGKMLSPYVDDHFEDGRGYRYDGTRNQSNLEIGVWSSFVTFVTLLGLNAVGCIIFILFTLVMTPGGALALFLVGGGLALAWGLFYTFDFWSEYLIAFKDSVCPIITWRE